jgi:uncharacterized protein (TIGR03435 family)
MRRFFVCLCALLVCPAFGQEFEVVSVKPNKSASNSSHMNSDQGRITATNATLRNLIVLAYGLKDYQVEGPDWLRTERFDLAAKFSEDVPMFGEKYNSALRSMMQGMLVQRFKLGVHRESKSFPVYALVVGKSGIKFKEVPDTDSHDQNNDNRHYVGKCVPMNQFVGFLERRMEAPVLDMTGLKGFYDFTLDWVPDPKDESAHAADVLQGPTLVMALDEQLGLKLEARKAPIEILVVDHAERTPTEN